MMLTNHLRMAGEMYIRRRYLSETDGQVQLGPQQAKRIKASCLINGPTTTLPHYSAFPASFYTSISVVASGGLQPATYVHYVV